MPFINVLDDIYYNEFNPYAAQWLRNLIAAGRIAPGVVDERSIEDVTPDDLRGFTQCHFFAGIGVWSFALRSAGWADDREIWTGSCPCQPFSAAGTGAGFADERHLWPAFHHLIAERRPAIVLGEQVASSHVDPWIDLVHADLEAVGYAFGGTPFPSAGIGAPHIRDRLYWVANAHGGGRQQFAGISRSARVQPAADGATECLGQLGDLRASAGGLADAILLKRPGRESAVGDEHAAGGRIEGAAAIAGLCGDSGLGDASGARGATRVSAARQRDEGHSGVPDHPSDQRGGLAGASAPAPAGPTNGFWRAADWLGCRDGKWRPVEPGTFPLANGPAGRVGRGGADWRTAATESGTGHRGGRLKGYGNAINAEAARIFVQCVMGAV